MDAEQDVKRWYAAGLDLAELPWFELREGRLRLVDDQVGPIVDFHTHLALTFGRRRSVDLFASPGPTRHYLPMTGPLDMDVYQNVNFTPEALGAMKRDLGLGSFTKGGMRTTHTAPNLSGEMADLGIVRSVLLPIDFPFLSHNAETYLEVVADIPELVSYGSVHPHDRNAAERLAAQKRAGAIGVKLHPAVQLVAPDHPRAMALYPVCADLGLPVLWHCGPVGIEAKISRRKCQLKHYWRAVHDHPNTTFILGHSGALQMELGLELAQRYPNVYLELASQGYANVERILKEAPIERVMLGSDWPFYHQAIGIAKVLLATRGRPTERRLVLYDNAAKLLGLAPS
ncbi:MAG: amidohydrolase family protein [Deltaproteobacteria bacterium]|nr:amidohydrolase family protein [Deltaproteobacteria bacterium]